MEVSRSLDEASQLIPSNLGLVALDNLRVFWVFTDDKVDKVMTNAMIIRRCLKLSEISPYCSCYVIVLERK